MDHSTRDVLCFGGLVPPRRLESCIIPGYNHLGSLEIEDPLKHSLRWLDKLAEPLKRAYLILSDEQGQVVGGIGLAEFAPVPGCAELQKLYLSDGVKGAGLGYEMIRLIEEKARQLGYRQMYLETHTNLQAAMHIYEKSGYRLIPKPDSVVHSTMNRFFMKDL